jgi:hypothetical protein
MILVMKKEYYTNDKMVPFITQTRYSTILL